MHEQERTGVHLDHALLLISRAVVDGKIVELTGAECAALAAEIVRLREALADIVLHCNAFRTALDAAGTGERPTLSP